MNLNINTDEHGLASAYSYSTCIAVRLDDHGGIVVVNRTKYSVTTSKHVGKLWRHLRGVVVVDVEGLPEGCSRQDLVNSFMKAENKEVSA
jgi:hypothetical protein